MIGAPAGRDSVAFPVECFACVACCLHGLSMEGDLPGRPAVTVALAEGRMIEGHCARSRYGEAGLKGSMGGGGGADMGGFNNPFDLFEQFFGASVGGRGGFGGGFGGMGARSRAVQGEDERYEVVIDFNDAVFGCRHARRCFSRLCAPTQRATATDDMKTSKPDPTPGWRQNRNLG